MAIKLYMFDKLLSAIYIFAIQLNLVSSDLHCPALAMNFGDFGITGCSPSFRATTQKDVEDSVKDAHCLGWRTWKVFPPIGCSSPPAKKGVVITYPCSCNIGGKCEVRCEKGYALMGSNSITCKEDGTYTDLPQCVLLKCADPQLPGSLKIEGSCDNMEGRTCFVTCISSDYRIHGNNTIQCKLAKWSEFPTCILFCPLSKIPSDLHVGDCKGDADDVCSVKCKNEKLTLNGDNQITCLPSGEWSKAPVCGCNPEAIPYNIVLKKGCVPSAGSSCDAMCLTSYYKASDVGVLVCTKNGDWNLRKSILCLKLCPEPELPDGMEIVGMCDARRGKKCKVRCKDKLSRLSGSDEFFCMEEGEYSQMPGCAKMDQCSHTVLPGNVMFLGECTYLYGETCSVGCRDSTFVLEGSSSITCTSTGTWSAIPTCVKYCNPLPKKDNMKQVPNKACNLQIGAVCSFQCEKNFVPSKVNHIQCLRDGTWEQLHDCERRCPELDFPNQCLRSIGSECTITCREGFDVIPPVKMVCQTNGEWTKIELPKCEKPCDLKKLPDDFKFVNCEKMYHGDQCQIACRNEKKEIFGGKSVSCNRHTGLVIYDSSCVGSCGIEKLLDDLVEVTSCKVLKPKEKCIVKCANRKMKLKGSAEITCIGDGKLTEIPKCEYICLPPPLPAEVEFAKLCTVHEGSICTVKCRMSRYVIAGMDTFEINCKHGVWTVIPPCERECPSPALDSKVELKDPDCSSVEGSVCQLQCRDTSHTMIGPNEIKCARGQWQILVVTRCSQMCSSPSLPPFVYIVNKEECSFLANTQCKVDCYEPYMLFKAEHDYIVCDTLGMWSKFSLCAYPCPAIKYPATGVCSRMPGSKCYYDCPKGYEADSMVSYCDEDSVWSITPGCTTEAATSCSLPYHLAFEQPNCDFGKGKTCTVRCADPIKMLEGNPVLECTPDYTVRTYPECKYDIHCPPPKLEEGMRMDCNPPFPAFKTCYFDCVGGHFLDGFNFMFCLTTKTWFLGGICVKTCNKLQLTRYFSINDFACTGRINSYCGIMCRKDQELPDPDSNVFCSANGQWEAMPACKPNYGPRNCPSSLIPPVFNTRYHKFSINLHGYFLSCKEDKQRFDFVGPLFITCMGTSFSLMPECHPSRKPDCPTKLPNGVECRRVKVGDKCTFFDAACKIQRSAWCLPHGTWTEYSPACYHSLNYCRP